MRRVLSLLVSLSWLVNGCTGWRTEVAAPAVYIPSHHPESIRLTLQDSSRLALNFPEVVGDSIVGVIDRDLTSIAFAQQDVPVFQVRGGDGGTAADLVPGIVGGLLAELAGLHVVICAGAGCGRD